MRFKSIVLLVMVVILVITAGCAAYRTSSNIDSDSSNAISAGTRVIISEGSLPGLKYEIIGPIEVSVKKLTASHKDPTRKQANDALIEKAAVIGADAVINVTYESGVGFTTWGYIDASGTGVKLAANQDVSSFENIPSKHSPSHQESLIFGFNVNEWTVGNQTSDQNQRVIEFVRPSENINNWTELLTSQVFRRPTNPESIDSFVTNIHAENKKLCPGGFSMNIIARGLKTNTEEASIIYEWEIKNCLPHANQHEVATIIYGKFSIFRLAYVERTDRLATEKRQKWIKHLKGARVMAIR